MKLHACLLALIIEILTFVTVAAQTSPQEPALNTGYYVVVAAFKPQQQTYAERYARFL